MHPFTGTWTVELEADSPPAYIRLRLWDQRIEGEYQLDQRRGHIDGRPDTEDRFVFSFEGIDGEALVNGAGIATIAEDRIDFTLMYHFGEDHTFRGTKAAPPPASPYE